MTNIHLTRNMSMYRLKSTQRTEMSRIISVVTSQGTLLLFCILLTWIPSIVSADNAISTSTNGSSNCNHAGVLRSDTGYTFARLRVDQSGNLVDEQGCVIRLLGFNIGGAFQGNGGAMPPARIQFLKHAFPSFNLARVSFNSRWWLDDVLVPKRHMSYRRWLATMVSTLEQNGIYVELDATTNFPDPPCGKHHLRCPSENQGEKDYLRHNRDPKYFPGLQEYQPTAVQALRGLAQEYAHDPAVIFNVWNEPARYVFLEPVSDQQFAADMNERITTVRTQDPDVLVVVFGARYQRVASSYTESNLVMDDHPYEGHHGRGANGKMCHQGGGQKLDWLKRNIALYKRDRRAVMIGEWGGCYFSPEWNRQLIDIVKQLNLAGMAYFHDGDLVRKLESTFRLNRFGKIVADDYKELSNSYTYGVAAGGPHAVPTGEDPPNANWKGVSERTWCEAMNSDYCAGLYGFRIYADGRFIAGYLLDDRKEITGHIGAWELAQLRTLVANYLSAASLTRPTLAETPRIPGVGDRYVLEYAGAPANVIFERGAIGGEDMKLKPLNKDEQYTKPLVSYIHQLMARYYPRPFLKHY